jgi:Tol biopolymer transport system component
VNSHERLRALGTESRPALNHRAMLAIVALAAAIGFAVLAISMSDSGDAAFPGANGRIAYASGDSYSYWSAAIWSVDADGGSPMMLASGAGVSAPSYSPDGSRIAFDQDRGVAVINAIGSGFVQLLTGSSSQSSQTKWMEDYVDPHSGKIIPIVRIQSFVDEWQTFDHPSFSPNGTRLAVTEATGKRTNTSICAVAALNEQACLGFGNPNAYFNFEYSCNACGSHLILIDSATGARIESLTALVGDRKDTKPAYSADGKIAFSRAGQGGSSIFVLDSPGTAPRRVTNGQSDRAPDFSPDGSKIVFSHGYADIGLVGVGGGTVQLLPVPAPPEGSGGYVNTPVFSPDGSRIALRREVYGAAGRDETGLFTIGLDGSGFTRIAADGFAPSWQPSSPPLPGARPKARARKGKIKLNKRGRAMIGVITCGGTPCTLKVLSARLKTGGKACQVRTRLARKLAPGKRARLGIKVFGRCLIALEKAETGRLITKVRAKDSLGRKALTLKSSLVPYKEKKKKHAGK